jgi:hypothetical protein
MSSSRCFTGRARYLLAFLIAVGLAFVLSGPVLARTSPSKGQYHIGDSVVSRACSEAVSPCRNADGATSRRSAYFRADLIAERQLDLRSEGAQKQYHAAESGSGKRELMLQIGFGLGLLYLAFLTAWFWATRRRRH